jgi:hypothetical protein
MARKRADTGKPRRQESRKPAIPAARRASGTRLYTFYRELREILEQARATAARSVNTAMVRAYWLVGRKVVEEEQHGSARAGYGEELIDQLSARLRADVGRGYTPSNLRYMRLFYLAYPNLLAREIHHAVRDESGSDEGGMEPAVSGQPCMGVLNPDVSWTHYRLLTKVESPLARDFYEIESVRNHWSSRELERQINSLLFEKRTRSRFRPPENQPPLIIPGTDISPHPALAGNPDRHRLPLEFRPPDGPAPRSGSPAFARYA